MIPAAARKSVTEMRDRCIRISRARRDRLAKMHVSGGLLATRRMRRTLTIVAFVVLGVLLPTDYMLRHKGSKELVYTHEGRTMLTLGTLRTQLECFRRDCGRYPTDLEGLWALRYDLGATNWHGPYVPKVPPDLWRNPYRYGCTNDAVCLWSDGPDGRPHTADDLQAPPPDLDYVRITATNLPRARTSEDAEISILTTRQAAEQLLRSVTNRGEAYLPSGR
jgi:hypothetical protein